MKNHFRLVVSVFLLNMFCMCGATSTEEVQNKSIEILSLDIISYEDFIHNEPEALAKLDKALHEKGIVGIKGVPGFKETVRHFIEASREFSSLPEEVKEKYAPDRTQGDLFLGYEVAKEKFQRPDGRWVVDELKESYFAYIPNYQNNKWPTEVDLQTPFRELGTLMSEMGTAVMQKIGLIGPSTGIYLDDVPRLGRMLFYRKNLQEKPDNPFWCGAHYDLALFTALLPAFYFVDGKPVEEPLEAGLFVKTPSDGIFKKVIANDPDLLLFQVGEFGQLVTNDSIKATEHRVHKATGAVERYTLALFFDPPVDTVVHSFSELTKDPRYGGAPGTPCSFLRWREETFRLHAVDDDD